MLDQPELTLAVVERDDLDLSSSEHAARRPQQWLKLLPAPRDLARHPRRLRKTVAHADKDSESLVDLTDDAAAQGSPARGAGLDGGEVEAAD